MVEISGKIIRQFGNVAGNTSNLVQGEHMGRIGISACLATIDIGERLSVSVFDFIAARDLLDRPWWRETPLGSWHQL